MPGLSQIPTPIEMQSSVMCKERHPDGTTLTFSARADGAPVAHAVNYAEMGERATATRRNVLLDSRTDSHPILDHLMSAAVTGLYLVADGGSMSLAERVSGGHSASRAPTGGEDYHDLMADYYRCSTHRQRLVVIREAQETLRRIRHSMSVDRSLIPKTPEWKAAIRNDPRPVRVLADVYGIGKSTVARLKAEAVPVAA